MGTPMWGDHPPLCYFAEPIDKASGQNFAVAATMVSTLATWGCCIFRPSAGFRNTQPDRRVEDINRHALYQADLIVAYLSETTPSIGVPAEIEAATARGIPAVVHYTGQSFVLAGNPLVTVIDDANVLIGAVEHVLKEHPRREVHYTQGGWCATCGGTGDPRYQHVSRYQISEDQLAAAHGLLPPCPTCGFGDWPQGGMHAARAIHIRNHQEDQIRVVPEQLAHPLRYAAGEDPPPFEPIRVVLAEGAEPPSRAYPDDAGLDLTTAHEITIQPGEYKDVRTQVVASQLPTGYHAQITGRSSALRKWRLHIPQSIIDPGWRGPLFVGVWNLGGNPVTLRPGDRVGQLILIPNTPAPVQVVTQDELDEHPRGLNGFGSSG